MATALASALSSIPVRQDIAMTGEVTLRGRVLKIGGLKEKALAAHRRRIRDIIIPKENIDDIEEISPEVRRALRFHPVEWLSDVFALALTKDQAKAKKKPVPPSAKKRGRKAAARNRPSANA
jgi:ATP-dependent Lon protease